MHDIKILYDGVTYNCISDFKSYVKRFGVSTAKPNTVQINVPYRNGLLDLTDSVFGGKVTYQNREITMTMLYAGDDMTLYRKFCNTFDGKIVKLIHTSDSDHYWEGRMAVTKLQSYNMAWEFVITMSVFPYKRNVEETLVSGTSSSNGTTLTCANDRMDAVPSFTVDGYTVIKFGSISKIANTAGTYSWEDIVFSQGTNEIVAVGSSTYVEIKYREGSL